MPKVDRAKASKEISTLLQNPKKTNWNAIKSILTKYYPSSSSISSNKTKITHLDDGIFRKVLKRACHDPSVDESALKIILRKIPYLSLPERVQYASIAARCQNMTALQAIIHDNVSVLFHYCDGNADDDSDGDADDVGRGDNDDNSMMNGGTTLLHMVCEDHGWNDEISFILKKILEHTCRGGDEDSGNNNEVGHYQHKGLFQETTDSEIPLKLSLQAGSDLNEIIQHLREEYPSYFERNLNLLTQIIAEYCYDMTLFCEIICMYPYMLLDSLHPDKGSSPLHFACYYQNEEMIRVLLKEYYTRNGTYSLLQKRLLSLNNEQMTPLGYLLLNIGESDDANAWRCIDTCVRFFSDKGGNVRLYALHLLLSDMWDQFIKKKTKNCIRLLKQIIVRLRIDLCCVDDNGQTVLSILIVKMSSYTKCKKTQELSIQILDYLLSYDDDGDSNSNSNIDSNSNGNDVSGRSDYDCSEVNNTAIATWTRRPAATRENSGRLPLNLACEYSLPWARGLGSIVKSYMPALESFDPVTHLSPFAHFAVGEKSDLSTIYELLRHHPSIINSIL
jgi:hypothetical protein